MNGVVWVLAAALTMSGPETAAASFCQRMAAKLPMKEKRVEGTQRAFDLQTMPAARRLLIGGTTYFSMKLEPIDDTAAERQRIEPRRVCRRPQLLRGRGYDEQDDEQVLA